MMKGMKTLKKAVSMGIAVVTAVGLLSGCGNSGSSSTESNSGTAETGEVDTSKEVELVMYVISDRPPGQDAVDENLNRLLKEKLNCTLKINWIGWAEYANKYPLLFSSGEEFDMAYSANWLNFTTLAQKGAFKNLDELWPAYAPDNFAAANDIAKSQATVSGHYYCVPTQLATYAAYGPIYRGDLVEDSSWDGVMENFEDIEEYCDIVKELHPEMEPLEQYSAAPEWSFTYMLSQGYGCVSQQRYMWFDMSEESPKVITLDEYDKISDFLEMMKRWNEKGFFSKSALSDTDSQKFQNGKAALKVHNIDQYRTQAILNPDWDVHYSNFTSTLSHLPYTQDCMVISNTAKNPERAMALWNLITTDQEVYDAFMYGVLDTTYKLDDKGQFEILDTDLYSEGAMWAARTDGLNRNQIGTPEDYNTMREGFENEISEDGTAEKYASFVLDTSSIETELAACNNVWQQYWWPLELAYTDPVDGLAEFAEKMKAAGIDKIKEEAQRQLDEYVANH